MFVFSADFRFSDGTTVSEETSYAKDTESFDSARIKAYGHFKTKLADLRLKDPGAVLHSFGPAKDPNS